MLVFIESINYQLVPEGTVEMSFVAGVVLALVFIVMVWMLYIVGKKNLFRNYLTGVDESSKKEIIGVINNIEIESDFLAMKTNTTYFKSLANEFHDLVCLLKRRNIP